MLVSGNVTGQPVFLELPNNSKGAINDGSGWISAKPPTPPLAVAESAPGVGSNAHSEVRPPPPHAIPYALPNGMNGLPPPGRLPSGAQHTIMPSHGFSDRNERPTVNGNVGHAQLPFPPQQLQYAAPVYPGLPPHQEISHTGGPPNMISMPAHNQGSYSYFPNPYGGKTEYQQLPRQPSFVGGGPGMIAYSQESASGIQEHYRRGTPAAQPELTYSPFNRPVAQNDPYIMTSHPQPNSEFHRGQNSVYPPPRVYAIPQQTPPGIPVPIHVMSPQHAQGTPQYQLPPGYVVVNPQHNGGAVQIANPDPAGYSTRSPGVDLQPPQVLNSMPVPPMAEEPLRRVFHTSAQNEGAKKWNSTDTSHEVKRRTKSGCLTCRRRRVKCDELRPQCRNCYKAERVCLGYDTVFLNERLQRIKALVRARIGARSPNKRTAHPLKLSATEKRVSSPGGKGQVVKLLDESYEILPPLRDNLHDKTDTEDKSQVSSENNGGNDNASCAVKPDIDSNNKTTLTNSDSDNQQDEKSIVANSWKQVAENFKDRLGENIDELLGLTCLYQAAGHVINHFNMKGAFLANVASKVEVMRQMLMIVFPSIACENLDVSELTKMEKLHATDEYSILRALIEALVPDDIKKPGDIARASITARYPQARYTRRPEQPRRMAISFARIENLAKLLYTEKNGQSIFFCGVNKTNENCGSDNTRKLTTLLCSVMDTINHCGGTTLSDKVWEAVEIALESININQLSEQEICDINKQTVAVEKMKKLAESGNPLGAVALLAFSACHSSPARAALKSTEIPPGLASTIVEIALLQK